MNFAVVLEKNGKYEEAANAYDNVIRLNPNNQEAVRGHDECLKEVRRNVLKDWEKTR